jgi:hypothetical protein
MTTCILLPWFEFAGLFMFFKEQEPLLKILLKSNQEGYKSKNKFTQI